MCFPFLFFKKNMYTSTIEKIQTGSLSERELINLYNNALQREAVDVIDAIERQMRGQFPRAANRLFGKKEKFAEQCLSDVLGKLGQVVNLEGNKLKNGSKPGGQKLSGEKYLNVYASYRNDFGIGGYLSMEQDTIESELYAIVGHYKIGNNGFRNEQRFTMGEFVEAGNEYIRIVRSIID